MVRSQARPSHEPPIATWVRHQHALASLRVALAALETARIPVLVVKGMVLAYALYDDVARRPMADVDLRIRPTDFVSLVQTLRARGFRLQWNSRQLGAVALQIGQTLFEIETSVGPPGLCALTISQMMSRARQRTLDGGLLVREPDPVDHCVLLVVNAFKDKMIECPQWSVDDLDTLLQRVPLEEFLDRVTEAKLRTVVWLVAEWMTHKRPSTVWDGLRERLAAECSRQPYARIMRRLLPLGHDSMALRTLARIACDSPPRRAWAIAAAGAGLATSAVARTLRI